MYQWRRHMDKVFFFPLTLNNRSFYLFTFMFRSQFIFFFNIEYNSMFIFYTFDEECIYF